MDKVLVSLPDQNLPKELRSLKADLIMMKIYVLVRSNKLEMLEVSLKLPIGFFHALANDKERKLTPHALRWLCGRVRSRYPSATCIACGKCRKETLSMGCSISIKDDEYFFWTVCINEMCMDEADRVIAETTEKMRTK